MTNTSNERRIHPRIEINGSIAIHTEDSNEPYPGELEDLSMGGARIWIDKRLPESSQLLFRIESNDIEELSQEFIATLLHVLPERKESMYGYGCRIEEPGKFKN